MKNRWTILVLLFSCSRCWGQVDDHDYHASLEAQGVFTSDHNHVPFWMRSDRFGSVPLPGASASFLAAASKDYSPQAGLVDWGASLLLRADVGSSSRVTLIEGYVKARFSIFQFRAGRIREFTGLVDSTLSSGAFATSGNALGIPKVQLAIPEYFPYRYLANYSLSRAISTMVVWRRHHPVQPICQKVETLLSSAVLLGPSGKAGLAPQALCGIYSPGNVGG